MSDGSHDIDPREFVERFGGLKVLSEADAGILLQAMQRLDLPAGKVVIAHLNEVQVDFKPLPRLNINNTLHLSLNWTPSSSGDHTVQISSWYGPYSEKLDKDWSNNNVTLNVSVLSRPDVEVTSSDIIISRGTVIEPGYIEEKDVLDIDVTVRNKGTSRVDFCNISLWEGEGEGS